MCRLMYSASVIPNPSVILMIIWIEGLIIRMFSIVYRSIDGRSDLLFNSSSVNACLYYYLLRPIPNYFIIISLSSSHSQAHQVWLAALSPSQGLTGKDKEPGYSCHTTSSLSFHLWSWSKDSELRCCCCLPYLVTYYQVIGFWREAL